MAFCLTRLVSGLSSGVNPVADTLIFSSASVAGDFRIVRPGVRVLGGGAGHGPMHVVNGGLTSGIRAPFL
jgi:hypothetical protein